MTRSGDIGTWTAERVAVWFIDNGWAGAERSALHGNRDRGDLTGMPGVCVEVKGGKAAEVSAPADLATWQAQTLAETINARADIGVLITKRRGYGATRVGDWWAWLYLPQLSLPCNPVWQIDEQFPAIWARVTVADAALWLRMLGYGDPIEVAA